MDPLGLVGGLVGAGLKMIGGQQDRDAQRENAERNIALQKEFAQTGIQWKVEDAKKAGIHPLYALGASTSQFAPVSVGSNSLETMSGVGQDISRAINATRSTSDKVDAFTSSVRSLTLTKMGLENQLLASQIAKTNQTGPSPGMPVGQRYLIDGQGSAPLPSASPSGVPGTLITEKPLERTPADPKALWSDPGSITDVGFARTSTGGQAVIPSKDVKERIEDIWPAEVAWGMRNYLLPTLGFQPKMDHIPLPEGGYDGWWYNPFTFQYQPAYDYFGGKGGRVKAYLPWKPPWR